MQLEALKLVTLHACLTLARGGYIRSAQFGANMTINFELSEEQSAIRDMANAFAMNEMAPHARKWDEDSHFPMETLRQAAALGFGGIYVGDDVGGSGLTRLDAALVFEEL